MAINRALLPQQLEAGAPDLRLTGDQSHRGTYTQRRRNQMAGGGIASMRDRIKYNVGPGETLVGKPGGIVEPGVKQYGILSKIKDKIVDDLIPNEIKENPVATALAGGALLNQFGLPDWLPGVGDDVGQNWLGELLGAVPGVPDDLNLVIGDDRDLLGRLITGSAGTTGGIDRLTGNISDYIIGGGIGGTGMEGSPELAGQLRNLINYTTGMEGSPELASNKAGLSSLITGLTGDFGTGSLYESIAGGATDWMKQKVADQLGIQRATAQPKIRWMEPLAIGLGIGAADAATRKDHQLPADLSINIPQTAQAAMDDPNLRFKPPLEATQLAADGGRIGFKHGSSDYKDFLQDKKDGIIPLDKTFNEWLDDNAPDPDYDKIYAQGGRIGLKKGSKKKRSWMDFLYDDEGFNLPGFMLPASIAAGSILPFLKEGGRVPAQEGGLMDLGGMEKDYRQEGGFVPIGGEEKADDVPARLSKNEFVFTADAVRAAGGGDIDEGAAVMERLMENLEAGGTVSEESQGLEGAREMFATAQELEKRII